MVWDPEHISVTQYSVGLQSTWIARN